MSTSATYVHYGYSYPTTPQATNPKATVSPRERDDLYYKLLAGAAQTQDRSGSRERDLHRPESRGERGGHRAVAVLAGRGAFGVRVPAVGATAAARAFDLTKVPRRP